VASTLLKEVFQEAWDEVASKKDVAIEALGPDGPKKAARMLGDNADLNPSWELLAAVFAAAPHTILQRLARERGFALVEMDPAQHIARMEVRVEELLDLAAEIRGELAEHRRNGQRTRGAA